MRLNFLSFVDHRDHHGGRCAADGHAEQNGGEQTEIQRQIAHCAHYSERQNEAGETEPAGGGKRFAQHVEVERGAAFEQVQWTPNLRQ